MKSLAETTTARSEKVILFNIMQHEFNASSINMSIILTDPKILSNKIIKGDYESIQSTARKFKQFVDILNQISIHSSISFNLFKESRHDRIIIKNYKLYQCNYTFDSIKLDCYCLVHGYYLYIVVADLLRLGEANVIRQVVVGGYQRVNNSFRIDVLEFGETVQLLFFELMVSNQVADELEIFFESDACLQYAFEQFKKVLEQ